METRGTGLTPQRMPKEWEKETLPMTAEAPQGPAKTSRPISSRDYLSTFQGDTVGGGFMGAIMASRPGMQTRQMGAVAKDVAANLEQMGSAAHETLLSTGPGDRQAEPGSAQEVIQGEPGPDGPMITKDGIIGKTLGKGTI